MEINKIVWIIVFCLLLYIYTRTKSEKDKWIKVIEKNENLINTSVLEIRPVFTSEELRFYKELKEYLKNTSFNLLSKVRIADLVKMKKYANYWEFKGTINKVNRKHIDFIITDIQGQIKCLIELNGYSHKKEETKESDNMKTKLFEDLKIPLIRFFNNTKFDFSEIKNYLT